MNKKIFHGLIMTMALLTSCAEEKEARAKEPGLRQVFGQWLLSRSFNDLAYLRKDGVFFGDDQSQWPRFDLDESGQLGLRSNYDLDNDAGNKFEFCITNRIVWAPRTSEKYRDFYVECRSTGIAGETDFHIFGAYDFLYGPPKMKYNFRIFGKDNRYLRFTFREGDVYYFERVGD
jgi:hypothetical protein